MAKILIIEDEAITAKIIKKSLLEEKFQVVSAADGYQGVSLAHKEVPDLIILDLSLPAGDGLSVLKKIRLSVNTRDIPVIVLTGNKDKEYKQKVLDEGVEAYIEKPHETGELLDAIKKFLVE